MTQATTAPPTAKEALPWTPDKPPGKPRRARYRVLSGSVTLFVLALIVWVPFAAALVAAPERLPEVWAWLRGLPFVVEAVLWIVFLPVVLALGAWLTDWPLWVRAAIVVLCAVWHVGAFFPRSER